MPVLDLSSFARAIGFARRTCRKRPPSPKGAILGEGSEGNVVWPAPSLKRAGHVFCLAASGAGKSVMIASGLVDQLIAKPSMAALVVDPKADLVKNVVAALSVQHPSDSPMSCCSTHFASSERVGHRFHSTYAACREV